MNANGATTLSLGESGCGKIALTGKCQIAWNRDFLFVRVEVEDPEFIPAPEDGKTFMPGRLFGMDCNQKPFVWPLMVLGPAAADVTSTR